MSQTDFLWDKNRFVLSGTGIQAPVKILVGGDYHIGLADDRDAAYEDNYRRMKQYTSQANPDAFRALIEKANAESVDLLLLAGDMLSFPTQANVDTVAEALRECRVPYLCTAGNHDWHFEGLSGTEAELRRAWLPRLKALYPAGANPLYYAHDLNGLKLIVIDNSTNEILPEQLTFLKEQLAAGMPSILLVHVPLYVPGRNIFFSCGHPDWNAANDPYWQIERRPRWPEAGHTQTTLDFCETVFSSKNMRGIISGHIHTPSLDYFRDTFQISVEMCKPLEVAVLP